MGQNPPEAISMSREEVPMMVRGLCDEVVWFGADSVGLRLTWWCILFSVLEPQWLAGWMAYEWRLA